MQSLQGGDGAMLRLDQLEALYYELQLQLYDIQAEVLRCEELLLTAQLQSLRRQMSGKLRLRASEKALPQRKKTNPSDPTFPQSTGTRWCTTTPLRAPTP